MLFSVRITNHQNNSLLNICDAPLLGKKLVDNKLSIHLSESYYGERVVDQEEAEYLLKKCASINMAGEETISLSINLGIGTHQGVKEIDGVPFLIVFKM